MSDEKKDTPEEVPYVAGNLDQLPSHLAPWATNLDPHWGLTIARPEAGASILTRRPEDPPSPPSLPPSVPPPPSRLFESTEDQPVLAPVAPPPRPAPAPSSDRRGRLPPSAPAAARRLPPSVRHGVAAHGRIVDQVAPGRISNPRRAPAVPAVPALPAKRGLPLSVKKTNNRPKSSPATTASSAAKVPRWGTDFPRSGFTPSGTLLESGSLKGHFSKEECRGTAPVGTTDDEWKNKFRSAESVLMKQLKQAYGNKAGKEKLDQMRDEGWVHDRALYMLQEEKKKKAAKEAAKEKKAAMEAAKEAAKEKKPEDEDVEMAEGEEGKEAEEEAEVEALDVEMDDIVWRRDDDLDSDQEGIYNA
jgi:hypothetical protein